MSYKNVEYMYVNQERKKIVGSWEHSNEYLDKETAEFIYLLIC
jgi:hypothetical protein